MKKKENKQAISCDVETCTHNDGCKHCDLESIHISSDTTDAYEEVEEKEETVCDSFEATEDNEKYNKEEDD